MLQNGKFSINEDTIKNYNPNIKNETEVRNELEYRVGPVYESRGSKLYFYINFEVYNI